MTLKETLQSFLQMDYAHKVVFIKDSQLSLIDGMLAHIGSPDAELRDQYIYQTFHDLINNQLLSDEGLTYLFEKTSSKDLLLFQIREQSSDSVFTRALSALVLANLITFDAQERRLPAEMLVSFFEKAPQLMSLEQDLRTFVANKGWAHSIAASADLIVAVIKHPLFELRFSPVILQALKNSLWKGCVYVDDEEERFTRIINALIIKSIPEELLIEWIEQLFDKLDMHLLHYGYDETFFKGRTVTLNFMKTLYFSLKMKNQMPSLQNTIYTLIGKWFTLR